MSIERTMEIMKLDNIDGVGMGTAGLNIDFFIQAIKVAIELRKSQKV